MSLSIDKYKKLLDAIYYGSTSGRITWSRDQWSDSEEVFATVGEFKFGISPNKRGATSIILVRIYDSRDAVIDSFDDDDLAISAPPAPFPNFYQYMSEIHRTGMRIATGADAAIDKMIASLNNDF